VRLSSHSTMPTPTPTPTLSRGSSPTRPTRAIDVIPMASRMTRRHSRDDVGEDVGIGVVESELYFNIGNASFVGQYESTPTHFAYRSVVVHVHPRNNGQPLGPKKSFRPVKNKPVRLPITAPFLARDVIYTSRTYATMSVSVCLWRKVIGAL